MGIPDLHRDQRLTCGLVLRKFPLVTVRLQDPQLGVGSLMQWKSLRDRVLRFLGYLAFSKWLTVPLNMEQSGKGGH